MKKLRWGVIGAGGIADRRTIPGMMLAKNAELIAVMDINAEQVEKIRQKYGAKRGYTKEEDLLADPEVDAGAGHELTEALRGDLQHEQQRKAYGRADDPCCFLHRGSSHFRQPEHPLHPAQLPEQPPVFRCRSRCTTASAMSAASTRQTRIVARFIAAGPFSRILLPV